MSFHSVRKTFGIPSYCNFCPDVVKFPFVVAEWYIKLSKLCKEFITWWCFQLSSLVKKILDLSNILSMQVFSADHWNTTSSLILLGLQVFSAVFIIEAFLKLSALTRHYFLNKWNIFDLVIVVASIFDMAVSDVDGLSVIRICRLVSRNGLIFSLNSLLLNNITVHLLDPQ